MRKSNFKTRFIYPYFQSIFISKTALVYFRLKYFFFLNQDAHRFDFYVVLISEKKIDSLHTQHSSCT